MRHLILFTLGLGIVCLGSFASGQQGDSARLKPLYQQAAWVLSGRFDASKGHDPGGNPQTIYTFADCTHYKFLPNFGPIQKGPTSAFGVYGSEPTLDRAKKGDRFLVFLSADYGKVLAVVPATDRQLALLKDWSRSGVYSAAERARLLARAGRVVVVGKGTQICAESYPCQHRFIFPVEKVLKGQNVAPKLTFHGSYRSHDEIPTPLKVSSPNGRLILFLDADGDADTSVLAAIPWSAAVEKELSSK